MMDLPCLQNYTKEFESFVAELNEKHASYFRCNDGTYELIYYEMNNLSGKDLEKHIIEKNLIHPMFVRDIERKQYLKRKHVEIPKKVCVCCGHLGSN